MSQDMIQLVTNILVFERVIIRLKVFYNVCIQLLNTNIFSLSLIISIYYLFLYFKTFFQHICDLYFVFQNKFILLLIKYMFERI